MKYPYSNTFLNLWWLMPRSLQPRFIRIMYANHLYKWLRWLGWNIERSYKYAKALAEYTDFLDIKGGDK